MQFQDRLTYDATTKKAVSVRDGVQQYMGAEINAEPFDKVFTIYRSPATIANAAAKMAGIPLTDEHVDLSMPPLNPVGRVETSEMIDLLDGSIHSTLAVQNQIEVSNTMLDALSSGKRELSLGYDAKLIPHETYDFEQRDIVPHHLAVVERGRCGIHCAFIDTKGVTMHKAFLDADGNPNLEEIVQIASGLPEAIKKLDLEQINKIMPMLKEITAIARNDNKMEDETTEVEDDEKVEDAEKVEELEDGKQYDEESEEMKDGEKEEERTGVTDSSEFADALQKAIDYHTQVIVKARDFVDAAYSFTGKKTCEIMRDALKVEHGNQKFDDSELMVAFKLLKKSDSTLKTFGDSQDPFFKLKDKEL